MKLSELFICPDGSCRYGIVDKFLIDILNLDPTTKLFDSLHFFIEDVFKIFILLTIVIYLIAILRAGLDVERVRKFLKGKPKGLSYLLASIFGAITPFCSCSSIPMFLGFTSAGIPLGITMSFLITSPLINEVAIGMLGTLLGWKFTLLYLILGIGSGMLGGWFLDLIKAEKYLTTIGLKAKSMNVELESNQPRKKLSLYDRHKFAVDELKLVLKRIWIWILIGIGIGAFIHGFVPEKIITENLGTGAWWSVPAAVVMGIPLYSNASGMIPIAESLLLKGLPIGTTLALMMSTVAASIPEFILLKQVMKFKLLLIFFVMLLVLFTLIGWIFNSSFVLSFLGLS